MTGYIFAIWLRKERNEVKIQIRKESTSHSVYGVS